MAIGAFPIAKLALLGVKHISKPIGSLIKRLATNNNLVRAYIVAPPAHIYNMIEVRSKMFMLGMEQPKSVPPLTDTVAIEMGGDILGELIILSIGITFVMLEFSRQSRNEKRKYEIYKQQREELNQRIVELDNEIKNLKAKLNPYNEGPDQECY